MGLTLVGSKSEDIVMIMSEFGSTELLGAGISRRRAMVMVSSFLQERTVEICTRFLSLTIGQAQEAFPCKTVRTNMDFILSQGLCEAGDDFHEVRQTDGLHAPLSQR